MVRRFKLAIWEVGDIKIERTRARNIPFMSAHGNCRKNYLFGKTLRTRKFLTGKFLGPVLTESLRAQDSENIVGLGDRASVSKLYWLNVRS